MAEQTTAAGDVVSALEEETLFRLTPLQENDYPVLYQWFSDPTELHLWSRIRRLMSFAEFVEDVKRRMQWGLVVIGRDGASQMPKVFLELYDMALGDGTAAFLIYLAEPQRNAGYGILATIEFLSYAFRSYPLRKIYAENYEFNEHAIALNLAGGFREVGRLKKHLWWRDRYWDQIRFAITRETFEQLAQLLLGSWATGNGEVPRGFTQRDAHRLLIDLVSLPIPSQRPPADSRTSVEAPASAGEGPPGAQHRASQSLSTPGDIDDYVELAYSNREKISAYNGRPGFRDWTKERVREFLGPPGHIVYVHRDGEGRATGGLVCRDETCAGEPAVRIWTWDTDPNLDPEVKERAAMHLFRKCAREGLQRGRLKLFIYEREGSARAALGSRLMEGTSQPVPVPGMVVTVSGLEKTVQICEALLAEEAVSESPSG